MGLSNIEKRSTGYNLLKLWTKFWHNIIFYRSFIVLGKNNIPLNKPLIFTPNHQNALMDALALVFGINIQPVFIARSDIFKKPAIARILYFLKILPIYRVKDGYNSIKKSQEIINKTVDIITKGCALVILPEGNHSDLRRLRPLKKGFARMAFQAEESNNFELDLQIIPVGIDYDDYEKVRGSLIVNYGEPVQVKDFVELYKEYPAIAINNIKNKLSEHLKPLIVNIESEKYYELYNELRYIYRSRMTKILHLDKKTEKNRVYIDQELIRQVSNFEKESSESLDEFQNTIVRFAALRDKYDFTNDIIEKKGPGLVSLITGPVVLLATIPIFIYGLINNFIASWLPGRISKMIEDPQFKSSINFAISMVSFPVFYLIQLLIVLLVTNDWKILLAYAISLPVSGLLAWKWLKIFKCAKINWVYKIAELRKNKDFTEMQRLYDEIITKAGMIITER